MARCSAVPPDEVSRPAPWQVAQASMYIPRPTCALASAGADGDGVPNAAASPAARAALCSARCMRSGVSWAVYERRKSRSRVPRIQVPLRDCAPLPSWDRLERHVGPRGHAGDTDRASPVLHGSGEGEAASRQGHANLRPRRPPVACLSSRRPAGCAAYGMSRSARRFGQGRHPGSRRRSAWDPQQSHWDGNRAPSMPRSTCEC